MVSVFDIEANKLIGKVKEELKKVEQVRPPEWSKFVKTASTRSKPPEQDDFWYIRGAAILRQLYRRDTPTGVQRLRTKYGGKEQNISRRRHYKKGSGNIIRKLMQQLETAGYIKKVIINERKGRILTPKGKSFLDKAAAQVAKE